MSQAYWFAVFNKAYPTLVREHGRTLGHRLAADIADTALRSMRKRKDVDQSAAAYRRASRGE